MENQFVKNVRIGAYSFESFKEKDSIYEPDKKLTIKAYNNIVQMWNKDQKSRNFLKHIIGAFVPINFFNKILHAPEEQMKCAILNIRLTGIGNIAKEITKLSMENMFQGAKAMTENRTERTPEEMKKIQEIKNSIPVECLNGSCAYFSDTSTKFLSIEALIALRYICEELLFSDDKEAHFTINKKRLNEYQKEQKNKLNENEINRVTKATTYGVGDNMDDKTREALLKLQSQLQTK